MSDELFVRIEVPKGSRNKYELDERSGAIRLNRFLFSSVVYPTDYGYVPETRAEDGDPLDAIVCVSEPTFPGCYISAKVIALFRMTDEGALDDKIVCVPLGDPNWNWIEGMQDIPEQLRDEIAHFFSIYKELEGKDTEVEGWRSRADALRVIEDSRRRHRASAATRSA